MVATNTHDFPTAALVAEGFHAAWYLIRDPAGVDDERETVTGGRSLRSDRRLPYVAPPASAFGATRYKYSSTLATCSHSVAPLPMATRIP